MSKLTRALLCVLAVALIVLALWARVDMMNKHEAQSYPVVEDTKTMDTSAIELWCSGEDMGCVRMVGACVVDGLLCDDYEETWYYEEATLDPDGWYLMWIADNHTPDDVEDDVIVKLWAEVH